ncbi:hypothetical protein ALTERO38_90270 [Alteromonas sp. 38]|nr:hypothetical protein ALTERO38_90270 [Alteromonas sp. 38]
MQTANKLEIAIIELITPKFLLLFLKKEYTEKPINNTPT